MSIKRVGTFLAACLAAVLVCSASGFAQFSSAVEGVVRDTSGAVIPGVEVVATNVSTGVSVTVVTNSAGYYRIPALPPGGYKLTATKSGFKTVVRESITLEVAQIQDISVTMPVGGVITNVTVTGAPPLLQTTEANVSGVISGPAVTDLPLSGQNILDVIAQTPGVTGAGTVGDRAGANDIFNVAGRPQVNANGQADYGNTFYVDDTSVTDNPDGGSAKLQPNVASIQEVRVTVNNYSAEYGHSSSILTQIVTKSGSDKLHGSLFWFHQDNAITSRNFLQNTPDPITHHVVPAFRRNEFGFGVGGPIRKDRTFFFASDDELKSSDANTSLNTVETPDFVTFMKSNFPNNVSTALLSKFPPAVGPLIPGTIKTVGDRSPGCTGTGPLSMPCTMPLTGQAVFSTATPRNGRQWNVRIDQNFANNKDRLYGSIYRMTVASGQPSVRPAFTLLPPGNTFYTSLNWTHAFSSSFVNEAAGGYVRNLGFQPCANCQVPGMFVSGLTGFGNFWGPGLFVQNDFHWRDIASFNRGKHALKAGTEFFRDQDNAPFTPPVLRPFYGFLSVFDFAGDKPFLQANINFDPRNGGLASQDRSFRSSTYGFFVQDDWKARPNFTLNLGLRWDFSSNPTDATHHLTNLKLGSGATMFDRIAKASVVPVSQAFTDHRIGYFAPRLGFAWDPTGKGKLSVRGGYGVFFNRWPNKAWSDPTRGNPPYLAAISASIFNPSGPQPVFGFCGSDRVPYNCPVPTPLPIGLNPAGGPIAGLADVGGTDPGLRSAYAENWFFGVQYALRQNWVIESDYLGSMGHHLYSVIDRNRVAGDVVGGVLTRPNPYFGAINYSDNSYDSSYHGGTISLRKVLTHRYGFQVSYTFGKAIDLSDSIGGGSGNINSNVFDAWNIRRQRGLASFDAPRKLALNWVWELPSPNLSSWLARGLAGGWETSALGTMESGFPQTVFTDGADYNLDGNFFDLPNTPAFGNSKNGLSRSKYIQGVFSPSDFPVPPPGVEGNLGRNTFRGPGLAQVDFGLIKNNHIPWFVSEGANFQVRAEFFNVLNRVNLNGWDTDLASGTFGKATGAYTPRALQVALRIQF
ncbi:MAG: TonB-dependent receptor [Terriglobia bacterium]